MRISMGWNRHTQVIIYCVILLHFTEGLDFAEARLGNHV